MSMLENGTLYHFVGWGSAEDDEKNFDTLCKVLTSKQVGRPSSAGTRLEIDPTRRPQKGELIKQSVTCYCDIPRNELKIHLSKYGRFGVGLDRSQLSRWGARPVAYVPFMSKYPGGTAGSFLLRDLDALLKGMHAFPLGGPAEKERTVGVPLRSRAEVDDRLESTFYKDFLAFLKFFDGDLPVDHPEYYYAEREWRKFDVVDLELTLREIVVPAAYERALVSRFPQHAEKIRPSP